MALQHVYNNNCSYVAGFVIPLCSLKNQFCGGKGSDGAEKSDIQNRKWGGILFYQKLIHWMSNAIPMNDFCMSLWVFMHQLKPPCNFVLFFFVNLLYSKEKNTFKWWTSAYVCEFSFKKMRHIEENHWGDLRYLMN